MYITRYSAASVCSPDFARNLLYCYEFAAEILFIAIIYYNIRLLNFALFIYTSTID